MAIKAKQKVQERASNEPVQYQQFTRETKDVVEHNVATSGQAATHHGMRIAAADRAAANPDSSEFNVKKNERNARNLRAIQPHVKNITVNLKNASGRRADLFLQAHDRAQAEGRSTPRGLGWYFEHRGALNEIAAKHGADQNRTVIASGALSPQNAPSNERTGIDEMLKAHTQNTKIRSTAEGSAFLQNKTGKIKGAKAVRGGGHEFSVSDLTPAQFSKLSSAKYREHFDTGGQLDLKALARGGTQTNMKKAMTALRSPTDLQAGDVAHPNTSAKVHAYISATLNAEPGTPVHEEYMQRYTDWHNAHHGVEGAHRPDPHGLQHSTEGILNPRGATAEDTWMNSISQGQDLETSINRTNVGKTIGSLKPNLGVNRTYVKGGKTFKANIPSQPGQPKVTSETLKHAWNNMATQMAAKSLSRKSVSQLPSVAVQEVSWTEARIRAGKDPEFGDEMKQKGYDVKAAQKGTYSMKPVRAAKSTPQKQAA